MLTVTRAVAIDCPFETVCAQFGDVAHHAESGLHRGVTFRVTKETPEVCDYEQVTRVGPVKLRQQFRLVRASPDLQVNELLAGVFSPGSITFAIERHGVGARVTATLASESKRANGVLKPAFAKQVGVALAKALEEDRLDLESGAYPRAAAGNLQS